MFVCINYNVKQISFCGLWSRMFKKPLSLSVTELNRNLAGRDRWWQIYGYLGTFDDQPPGPVLVKADLGAQFGPSQMHPSSAEAATICGLLVATIRLQRASHRQCLILV